MLKYALRAWWRGVRDDWRFSGVRLWVDAYRDLKAARLKAERAKRPRRPAYAKAPGTPLSAAFPNAYQRAIMAQQQAFSSEMARQNFTAQQNAFAMQNAYNPYTTQGLSDYSSFTSLLGPRLFR